MNSISSLPKDVDPNSKEAARFLSNRRRQPNDSLLKLAQELPTALSNPDKRLAGGAGEPTDQESASAAHPPHLSVVSAATQEQAALPAAAAVQDPVPEEVPAATVPQPEAMAERPLPQAREEAPVAQAQATRPEAPAVSSGEAKAARPRKPRLVERSFTIDPDQDRILIRLSNMEGLRFEKSISSSEILRHLIDFALAHVDLQKGDVLDLRIPERRTA